MWPSVLNENFPSAALVIRVSNNISSSGLNVQMNWSGTFLSFEEGWGVAVRSNATGAAGSFPQLDQGGLGGNEAIAMKGIWGKINLILENLRNYSY